MKRNEFLESMKCNTYESEVSGLYYIDFDEDNQILFAGSACNAGISREYEIDYDDDFTLDENLEFLINVIHEDDYCNRTYANVTNRDIPKYDDYYDVVVPESCLPYLVNGDCEGYDENELESMREFEEKYRGKLIDDANVGDFCVPMEHTSTSFESYNDVYGWLGCDCYRFLLPSKVEVEHLSI